MAERSLEAESYLIIDLAKWKGVPVLLGRRFTEEKKIHHLCAEHQILNYRKISALSIIFWLSMDLCVSAKRDRDMGRGEWSAKKDWGLFLSVREWACHLLVSTFWYGHNAHALEFRSCMCFLLFYCCIWTCQQFEAMSPLFGSLTSFGFFLGIFLCHWVWASKRNLEDNELDVSIMKCNSRHTHFFCK